MAGVVVLTTGGVLAVGGPVVGPIIIITDKYSISSFPVKLSYRQHLESHSGLT